MNLKAISNHIAVKCELSELFNNKLKFENDKVIYFPEKWEPEKNVNTSLEVVSIPSQLVCSKQLQAEYTVGRLKNKPMPHITDCEIKVGDIAHCNYGGVMDSIGKLAGEEMKNHNRKYIIDGDTIYILIHYSEVIAVSRDGKLIPVNGYVIGETCKEKNKQYDKSTLILPSGMGKREPIRYVRVKYVGTKCRGYIRPVNNRFEFVNDDFWEEGYKEPLKKDCIVLIKDDMFVPLNFNKINVLNGLVYLRRWHINAIIEGLDVI